MIAERASAAETIAVAFNGGFDRLRRPGVSFERGAAVLLWGAVVLLFEDP
jgi:hypothetical protein